MTGYLTTKEVAERLRIKERKVYDLAASGALPCSKAMGKLLFPADAVEAWVARGGRVQEPATPAERPAIVVGSHDPLLDWALRESDCGLASLFDGSGDGLARFARGEAVAAGMHLPDPDGGWNVTAARPVASGAVLLGFAARQRGVILAPDRAGAVAGLADLSGLILAPRQPGSGAEATFAAVAHAAGLDVAALTRTAPARTETDAALAVMEGRADAAFGLADAARRHGLAFVPVLTERYDLLVDRRAFFEPPLQRFADFCRSSAFADRARAFAGYDVSEVFAVRLNGA